VAIETGLSEFPRQIQLVKPKKLPADLSGAPRSPMPRNVEPMLCTLVPRPFDRPNWIFEIKWDGYRVIAEIDKISVRLYSRKLKSLERYFPQLIETLTKLNLEAVLDGEVVVLDKESRSHFEALRHRQRREKDHLIYYVFDLLYLDGRDLRQLPLLRRKAILKDLIETTSPPGVQFSDHVEEQGKALFDVACEKALEGIVGKDADSPYVSGARTEYWVKFKNYKVETFHIGGFTGSLNDIQSLVFGMFKGKDLIYVGNTDKGLARHDTKGQLRQKLAGLMHQTSPFKNRPEIASQVQWVEPKVTCRVRFLEWTQDGNVRHATLVGLG
jgi:bifunctional non-homologous end joining protein LigD